MATVPRAAPLLGRDRELALLESALARARAGGGGAAMLEGEAGIGKTRLALELRSLAKEAGFLVAGATCYESDWSPPFGVWSLALGEMWREALEQQPSARLSVLFEAMPDLRGARAVEPPPALSPEESRMRAMDAIARLLLDIADRKPLLVVLDDLQWADRASLDVVAYLARFLTGAPLIVLGTYRSGAVGLEHPLARSLGELDRHAALVRVLLGPLSEDDALALVERLAGTVSPQVSGAIVRETGGHPLFITEVVRDLLDEGRDLSLVRFGDYPTLKPRTCSTATSPSTSTGG